MAKDKTAAGKTNNEKVKNPKKVNTTMCPKCNTSAAERESNKEGSIRCKICTFWWHQTCADLSQKEYELFLTLSQMGNPDLWQCRTCKVGMGDLGLRWEQTGKIVAENTARIEKVETRVEKEEARCGEDLDPRQIITQGKRIRRFLAISWRATTAEM